MTKQFSDIDKQRLYGYRDKARTEQKYTDDEIFDALRESQKTHGLTRSAYQTYYDEHENKPHAYTIMRRFGKWSIALEAAGLPAEKRGRYSNRISKNECVAAVAKARDILGHYPSVHEYTKLWQEGLPAQGIGSLKEAGLPSEGTIRLRCGTWRNALFLASE